MYPSPASRFGTRDSDSSRLTAVPFGPIGDDGVAMDVSPHFASRRESRRRIPDRRSPDGDRWDTSHSPFFDKFDGQERYSSGRESPQPRQLGLQGIGAVNSYRRGGARVCSDFEPPVAAASAWCPSTSELEERAWEGKGGDDAENRARGRQMQDAHGYGGSLSGGWAANVPDVGFRTTPPSPSPPPSTADFGAIDDPQNSRREACSKQQRAGRRLRGSDSDSPDPLIVTRSGRRRGWLGHLPAVAEETRSSKRCKDKAYTVEGGNARSLSKLFDYAFTDKGKGRRQGLDRTIGGSEISRTGGRKLDVGDDGRRSRATLPAQVEDPVREGQDARRPQSSSSPPPPSRDALGAGKEKQTLVGVTVRRPQSPQFGFMAESDQSIGFMAENDQSNGFMNENDQPDVFMNENDQPDARQRCPSWQQDSRNARRNEGEGSKSPTDGESKVDDAGQQVIRSRSHANQTGGCNEGPATPNTLMVLAGTAPTRSVEHSPFVGWAGEVPCHGAGTACTPPRASKRRRPESWATTIAAFAGTPPPFPLISGRSANIGRSDQEQALQPQSRQLDCTRSRGAESGLGLEGGRACAGGDTADAVRLPCMGDAAWVQGRGGLCDTGGESGVMEHAVGTGETITPPPPPPPPPLPEGELFAADGRGITQSLEDGMFAETPRSDSAREGEASKRVEENGQRAAGLELEVGMFAEARRSDSVREGDANGRDEEDSQRAGGIQLQAETFAETARLDLSRAGDAADWVEEGSQRSAGLERLDQQHERFVGGDETAPNVGATPSGTPPPRPDPDGGNNRNGPRDKLVEDASNVKNYPGSTASARVADAVSAYDRDVLGGDGLADSRHEVKSDGFSGSLVSGCLRSVFLADSCGRSDNASIDRSCVMTVAGSGTPVASRVYKYWRFFCCVSLLLEGRTCGDYHPEKYSTIAVLQEGFVSWCVNSTFPSSIDECSPCSLFHCSKAIIFNVYPRFPVFCSHDTSVATCQILILVAPPLVTCKGRVQIENAIAVSRSNKRWASVPRYVSPPSRQYLKCYRLVGTRSARDLELWR